MPKLIKTPPPMRDIVTPPALKVDRPSVVDNSAPPVWLQITWQEGPIPKGGQPNGVQIEDVLKAVIERLNVVNARLACSENLYAKDHILEALHHLALRTARRKQQGVEGTMRPHSS